MTIKTGNIGFPAFVWIRFGTSFTLKLWSGSSCAARTDSHRTYLNIRLSLNCEIDYFTNYNFSPFSVQIKTPSE